MKEYHKINSVFKRDRQTGKFIFGEFSCLEFEYLKDNVWVFDEKVDGTNIRIGYNSGGSLSFGGRTDAAQIPATLFKTLTEMFTVDRLKEAFPGAAVGTDITLYGEGYGAKIQKGGGDYIPDGQSFILFDVRIGDWWLRREDVEEVAAKLGIKVAPIVAEGTIQAGIDLCTYGFGSQLRNTPPEGIVLRPKVPLFARNGERIITKLKLVDFR